MNARAGRLALVGCGKMGGALLAGWLSGGLLNADDVAVVEPEAAGLEALGLDPAPRRYAAASDIPESFQPDTIVFAVKPQVMGDVAPAYGRFAEAGALAVSIAAGRTIASFEAALGSDAAVVRAMPNTPAAVGRGITALVANAKVDADGRATAERLLGAVGRVVWLDDESLMDAVTGVSGSGPAYVFHLVEAMAAAGEAAGLPAEIAAALARETVTGAGELLWRSPEGAATLRENVTSPGGTTAAALEILMGTDGLADLMTRAIAAATARSRELAS